MSAPISFTNRLLRIVIPTVAQSLACVTLALLILVFVHSSGLLKMVGVTPDGITASQDEFHANFDGLLRTPLASHLALVTFWALVGLVAYLVCWGVYNLMIEARNEVTLNTAYTNRGHWRGPTETLALKAIAAVGLALIVVTLSTGVTFWLNLSAPAVSSPSVTSVALALVSILGLALQLYCVLIFAQLTFTPWYRVESFTEA